MRTLDMLEAWLLDPDAPAPPPEVLRRAGVAAYAYTVGHPERAALRGDFLASLARHQRIKAELLPLLRAWNEAGVEVLLFKGFHLSEFVYPAPGARFHGDVDVVVRPERVELARRVARDAGWSEQNDTGAIGKSYFHNVCGLHVPGGATYVDLHRWAIHCELPWTGVPRRITEAVWSASRERVWEGVPVREPDDVDALLVGLILQRAWGGDRWGLKPHDAIDFRLLALRVPRERLEARARELGATATLRRFLARCDPPAGRLRLAPEGRAARWASDLAALPERGPLGPLEIGARALVDVRRWTPAALRGAAGLLRARRALRRHPDLPGLLASLTPARALDEPDSTRRYHLARAAVHLSRLLPANPRGDCLVRSLTIYSELRRQGWPVSFVSGVRRDGGAVVGHAWVELDGRVIPELGEPENRNLYHVNFVYPPE